MVYSNASQPLFPRLGLLLISCRLSTSGIALALAITPKRFRGLDTIGLVIFLLDVVFFLFISTALAFRFVVHPKTFRDAVTSPQEALFISTFFLSAAAILANISVYGEMFLGANVEGLACFSMVTFWMYLVCSFAYATVQYHLLFTVKEDRRLTIASSSPAWILPIFPVMMAGTVSVFISKQQPIGHAVNVLFAGMAAQGVGFFISLFVYSTYLSRLMAYGLPAQRPGMFIAVGPPAFTCAALIGFASESPRLLAHLQTKPDTFFYGFQGVDTAAAAFQLIAISCAMFLWGLSFWFFAQSTAGVLGGGNPDPRFHLSWWSFVFPNVGLAVACIKIGQALASEGVLWLGSVLVAGLLLAWAVVAFRCVRAVSRREIMWPGHDEDTR